MRRAKVDTTHAEIRQTLRQLGWKVVDTHALPGWIDMVAWHPGRQVAAFIDAKSERGKPTESQQKLVDEGWPIRFIRSVEEAVRL